MVLHEVKPGWTITKEWEGYTIEADVAFAEVQPESYLGIFFSGGRAPEYLRLNDHVIEFVQHFSSTQKPIAAICHGVQILAAAGVLAGRNCSAYPACRPEVESAGGQFVDRDWTDVCVDGNWVTAPAWPAHPKWLAEFLSLLGTEIRHADHASSTV